MLLHTRYASATHNNIIINSLDTDIFILLFSKVCDMDIQGYMMTGTSQNKRIININKVTDDIYEKKN